MMTDQLHCSRRSLLVGGGALAGVSLLAVPSLGQPGHAVEGADGLTPIVFGPAAITSGVRGTAYRDGRVYFASRANVGTGVVRLGIGDAATGEVLEVHDLDVGAASGNMTLAADDRYVYVGPAGNAHVWRFDPADGSVEPFVEVGVSNNWTYSMLVHEEHLYVGTYPACELYQVDRATGEATSWGRVGTSMYTTCIGVGSDFVVAATAAPGGMKVYGFDGAERADLTEFLTESPVGQLDLVVANDTIYVASGRFIVSMAPDGSNRVVRPIAEEDRYIDKLTATPDGRVLGIARFTSNYYEVTASGLSLLGKPWQDVSNQGFWAVDDEQVVGVTSLGHLWRSAIGGEATVVPTADSDFGHSEPMQGMLAHSDGTIWAGGYYTITQHRPNLDSPEDSEIVTPFVEVNGEPKSMVETSDGTVVVGMYPSTDVLAVSADGSDKRVLGVIGNEQMRPLSTAYDAVRGDALLATTGQHQIHTGAVTFANPVTGAFEVRRDFLPDQNIRTIAVEGDFAYVAGDVRAEAKDEPGPLSVASIAEIDLRTRTVSRTFEPADWAAYEDIVVVDGVLVALGRAPAGAWLALDLSSGEVIAAGDVAEVGGLTTHLGRVFHSSKNTKAITELHFRDGTSEVLYSDLELGYFNRAELAGRGEEAGLWGLLGRELAFYPLVVEEEPDPTEDPEPTEDPSPTLTPTPTPDPNPTTPPPDKGGKRPWLPSTGR